MKKFTYIVEKLKETEYTDLLEEIEKMVRETINSDDDNVYREFIESYIKNPEDSNIIGLINDSDIYDFYIKWRSDIDDILSEIDFYNKVPSNDLNVYSLYDYIIKGTIESVNELIKLL